MHTPRTSRTSRPLPPRPACVPALPDLSALLPKARPAPVQPNPFPLPAGRRHPVDPRPRATQIDVPYAIGRGKVAVAVPAQQAVPVAVQGIKCNVPNWQPPSVASSTVGTERTTSQRKVRTAGRLSTSRAPHPPSTAAVPSSRTPHPPPASPSKAAEALIHSTPPRQSPRPAFTPYASHPASIPAAGNTPSRSHMASLHSFRSPPPRPAAANPQRLECSAAFRGLTPRREVAGGYVADVAWLDGGVKGVGRGGEERREQESAAMVVERKRASGLIRTSIRSSAPGITASEIAVYGSASVATPSSRRSSESARRSTPLLSSRAASQAAVSTVEPAEFLSLIKSNPTRAFRLIFPDYDVDLDEPQDVDTAAHLTSKTHVPREEEEKEDIEMAAVLASPRHLSPYSAGWKYQQTAAFDVQRPDTAGERKQQQRAEERKEQISVDWIQSDDQPVDEEDEEDDVRTEEQSADAWTREAVQRIASHVHHSWLEPTTPQPDEGDEQHEAERDDTLTDRPDNDNDNHDVRDNSAYNEDEIEEAEWEAADEDEDDSSQPSAIGAVTVSPPSPPSPLPADDRGPPAFGRRRPSPLSTHFLRPELPAAKSASSSAEHSSTNSASATSAIGSSPSPSQQTPSSFTIAPSAPASPVTYDSDHERPAGRRSRRKELQEENEESVFEL